MRIFVNDEARNVAPGTTVAALVEILGCGRRGVAVAVAAEVVPRSAWEHVEVTEGDRVEVLRAVQGGCR
ncbi:MAG: sulfur carrier protein ThiS [Actinomycetota bacterium]|nr:sulfur carrier protein ThiS [Actinomycetota bacterium]